MNQLIESQAIAQIEQKMLSMPQIDCPVIHKFDNGHYIRELHMAAGTLAIGHHQNFPHLNIFLKGKVLMLNPDGTTKVLTAPMTFIGQPGRKVGYILEDVIWQNVYETDEVEVDKLEAFYLSKSDYFHQHAAHMFALESIAKKEDRESYEIAIAKLGYTEEQVQVEVQNLEDQIPMPEGDYKFKIDISAIHGQGVIATGNISAGEVVGPSKIGNFRTPLGRYTNHAAKPNAIMRELDGNWYLVATENIVGALGGQQGMEITVDYTDVVKKVRG